MLDCATWMVLVPSAFLNADIIVIQIYERSFLVISEEVVLLIIVWSFEGLH